MPAGDGIGPRVRIGVAGWSIPRSCAEAVPGSGSHLQRYASVFHAAEINSSFHRPHRPATYARWAAGVEADFRFSVKLPKTITHQRKLRDCRSLLAQFAEEIAGLGARRGPVLVQLPPSLAFEAAVVAAFFREAKAVLGPSLVCEPRHASWFEADADAMLTKLGIARVAADPARVPAAMVPGGWRGLAYFRLHGSPVIYRSSYEEPWLADHAATLRRLAAAGVENWTIFDNTASAAAMADALSLRRLLANAPA